MSYNDEIQSLQQSMSPARPQRDLSATLSLTIEGITLIGNIFPILVVTCVKKSSKKTVTDILICALAITDILAVLMPLPVSLPTFICQDGWKKGPAACHYYQFCVFWLQNVASLLVIAMSVERVMALAMPLRYKSWSTRNRVYLTIGGIYITTFMISCLPLFGLVPPVMVRRGSPFCRSWVSAASNDWYQSVFPMVLIVEFWTNMLIVLILNSFLVYYLIRFGRRLQPSSADRKGVIRRRLSSAVVADKVSVWRQRHNITVSENKTSSLGSSPAKRKLNAEARRLKHLSTATDDNGVWRLQTLPVGTEKYGTWRLKSLTIASNKSSSNRSSIEKDHPGTKKRNALHIDRRDFREFSKLVIVVAVLFYCTWLPVLVVMTLTQAGYHVSELVAVYALVSTTLNGLFNPFIYLILSRQYRQGYITIIKRVMEICCPATKNQKCCSSERTRELPEITFTAAPPSSNEIAVRITVI